MYKRLYATFAASLVCAFLLGCATAPNPVVNEHAASAAMSTALLTTLYRPDGTGGVTVEQKQLPWEANMGNYALSFVLDDPKVSYHCHVQEAQANVDIRHFPVFESPQTERAAIVGIVNTLVALPGIARVSLTFDGERLVALKNGTPVGEPFEAMPLEPEPTAQ